MHTSSSVYADEGLLGRAVPQRSLPPCGGGTGRGVQQARCSFAMRCIQESSSFLFVSRSALRIGFGLGVLSPPLSLSLPRKGGGNRGARTFAPYIFPTSLRGQMCACRSAFAGTTAESHFASGSIAALRRSGPFAGSAMNFTKAAATSGCFDAVSTPAPTRPYSIRSAGSGPR